MDTEEDKQHRLQVFPQSPTFNNNLNFIHLSSLRYIVLVKLWNRFLFAWSRMWKIIFHSQKTRGCETLWNFIDLRGSNMVTKKELLTGWKITIRNNKRHFNDLTLQSRWYLHWEDTRCRSERDQITALPQLGGTWKESSSEPGGLRVCLRGSACTSEWRKAVCRHRCRGTSFISPLMALQTSERADVPSKWKQNGNRQLFWDMEKRI